MKNKAFRDLIADTIQEANVIITGLPYDEGCSCGRGASLAPAKMRELSAFLPPLSENGTSLDHIKIFDNGDIDSCLDYHQTVKAKTHELFMQDALPIFLGGDHSVTIPLQTNFYAQAIRDGYEPVIIHLDAHPDICDFYDGSKMSHACTNKRAIDLGYDPANVILIGIRGYEHQEVKYLKAHPELKVFNACDIVNQGTAFLASIIQKYQDPHYAIYLSLDIDINDPAYAPGTGTPEAFGLSSRQVMEIVTTLFKKLNIKAFDMVEVSPPLDVNDITSWLALKILYEVFASLK